MEKIQLGDWGTYYRVSGSSTPGPYDFQTRWSIKYEQDLKGAISTIYVQPYLKIIAEDEISLPNITISTAINGTTKNQTISLGTVVSSGSYVYKYGKEQVFTIKHEDDGTAQCKFNGYMSGDYDGDYKKTASHSWGLPSINMASTISNDSSSSSRIDFGSDVTFAIERPNDTITHTLTYEISGEIYTIGTSIDTNIVYAFPLELINNYPKNAEVTIAVTCTSSNGRSSSTAVYLNVPDSYVPTISLEISDVGDVPNDWGIYVKGRSKIKGIITANGVCGSTIKSYSANVNGQTFNTGKFITSELNTVGDLTINVSAVDTRGRSVSIIKSISVCDYFTPTFVKLEVVRCDGEGNEDDNGTYGKVICQYSISPCNKKNAKSLQVSYGEVTNTFILNDYNGTIIASNDQLFSDLSISANHTFNFNLIDTFNETGIPQTFVMPPAYVLVSKKAGGKGIAFGQIAIKDGFHVYMDADFHNGICINGVPINSVERLTVTIDKEHLVYQNDKIKVAKALVIYTSLGVDDYITPFTDYAPFLKYWHMITKGENNYGYWKIDQETGEVIISELSFETFKISYIDIIY